MQLNGKFLVLTFGRAGGKLALRLETDNTTDKELLELDYSEREDLIDEIMEVFQEQRQECLNELSRPMLGSLHKFEVEIENNLMDGSAEPLPQKYLRNCFGLTKNKIHLLLRDLDWAIIFWQLSAEMKNFLYCEEQQNKKISAAANRQDNFAPNLTVFIYESPVMPKLDHQFPLSSLKKGYPLGKPLPQDSGTVSDELDFYSFPIVAHREEYKQYIHLRSGCTYYWAELHYYSNEENNHLLLARSSIIFKPQLLSIEPLLYSANTEQQAAYKLYELSNSIPTTPQHSRKSSPYIEPFSSVAIA